MRQEGADPNWTASSEGQTGISGFPGLEVPPGLQLWSKPAMCGHHQNLRTPSAFWAVNPNHHLQGQGPLARESQVGVKKHFNISIATQKVTILTETLHGSWWLLKYSLTIWMSMYIIALKAQAPAVIAE